MSATHTHIIKLIENHFKNKKISIIDYGCGNGDLLNYIKPNKITSYMGYEVSDDCLEIAKRTFKNEKIRFEKIDKKKLPTFNKNKPSDTVVLIGVIQYMSNAEINHLLSQVKKNLSNNGTLIISCSVDHLIYKILNIYQLFLPNKYINRNEIIKKLNLSGFKIVYQQEKGIFVAPLFSNIFSLFFDAFDRIFFKTRGSIGPVGTFVRKIISPLIGIEQLLPFDFGHTLYIVSTKK